MTPPSAAQIAEFENLPDGAPLENFPPEFLRRMHTQAHALDGHRLCGESRVRYLYRTRGIALFAGAGVSFESGIPLWREVVERAVQQTFPDAAAAASDIVNSLSEARISVTAQLELCDRMLESRKSDLTFDRVLYESLYGKDQFRPLREHLRAERWPEAVREFQRNTTLCALGDLLLSERPNPRIHAVLTTNADNLLQLYARAATGGKRLLSSIQGPADTPRPGTIPVFHLHGYFDARMNAEQVEDDDYSFGLIFKESEYFQTFSDPAAFANYVPLSTLQRHNTVIVGTALDDVNIRRWLYQSASERRGHRAAELRLLYRNGYQAATDEAYLDTVRHFWFRAETELPEPRHQIKNHLARSVRGLGTEIVWFPDFEALATALHNL